MTVCGCAWESGQRWAWVHWELAFGCLVQNAPWTRRWSGEQLGRVTHRSLGFRGEGETGEKLEVGAVNFKRD